MSDLLEEAFAALRDEHSGASPDAPRTRRRVLLARTTRRSGRTTTRLLLPLVAVLAATSAFAASGRLLRVAPPPVVRPALSPSVRRPPPPGAAVSVMALPDAAPSSSAAPTPRPRASAAPSDEEPLYAIAHDAHFVARDPARALTAWDAYLAKHPRGRLAPEARYNRAIALVRLGRTEEAKAALGPFAAGSFGSYRRAEARRLIDALD
jgi:hypothetical protein